MSKQAATERRHLSQMCNTTTKFGISLATMFKYYRENTIQNRDNTIQNRCVFQCHSKAPYVVLPEGNE